MTKTNKYSIEMNQYSANMDNSTTTTKRIKEKSYRFKKRI